MNKLSLKTKMLVYLLVPVLLVLAAMSGISYYYANNALESQVKRTLTFMTEDYSNEIEIWVAHHASLVNSLAEIVASGIHSEQDLRQLLAQLKRANPDVSNLSVGYPDKRIIDALNTVYPKDFDPTSRDWYKKAAAAQGIAFSEPYLNVSVQKMSISISRAVRVNGQVVAVVNVPLDLAKMTAIGAKIKSGQTGYGYILGAKGEFLYHPTLKVTDSIMAIENGRLKADGEAFLAGQPIFREYFYNGANKLLASHPIGQTGWALVVGVPKNELFEDVATLTRTTTVVSIIGLMLLSLVIFLVAGSVVGPVRRLAAAAERVAAGDLAVELEQTGRLDEIGVLATGFRHMVTQLRQLVGRVAQTAGQIAASSEELTAGAEQSAQVAQQVAEVIGEVAVGAEKQAKNMAETATIVQQLSVSTQEAATSAGSVSATSQQTADAAAEGSKAVAEATRQMANIEATVTKSAAVVNQLGERSKEIGTIANAISDIAGQTNLLALNAAIEAARAGEQGRGFAVVAEEVRKLAEQAQEAAKEIAGLTTEIQGDTEKAVTAMNDGTREVAVGTKVVGTAAQSFEQIAALINQTSRQIREISETMQQMAAGSQRIVASVRDVDRVGRETAANAQAVSVATKEQLASMGEIATASQTLAKMAEELQAAIQVFKL
ncbi:MAG: methyl-accepting chemotaxis protein [Negativicutes bacterium]|nr:methyl-accepting chemotaxis protein [Negativicutes bacterium]